MKKSNHYIDLRGLLLAFLLFCAFGAKELHHTFEHQHEVVKICNAQEGETHLHNHEYIPHECQLCDFTFAVYDFQLPFFQLRAMKIFPQEQDFLFKSFKISRKHLYQALRAPPFSAFA